MSDDHLTTLIGNDMQGTAEWRRRKAEEFPADTRNLNAAEELERLAAEIEKLEGSEIHQQICDVQERINRIDDGDLWIEVSPGRVRGTSLDRVSRQLRYRTAISRMVPRAVGGEASGASRGSCSRPRS